LKEIYEKQKPFFLGGIEMKKQLFAFVFLAGLLGMLAGCASGSAIQTDTPAPTAKGSTPSPNNQIKVPGVSIQVYAPNPNPLRNTPDAQGYVASVVLGLWHGIISPITLIVSFFKPDVTMYEVHNDGSLYNLGFLLGLIILFVALFLVRRR
jgi:hypothetical protein